MTSADFRRDVERELEQLRRAHVIAAVEIETDMVVGVRLALDGKPYAFTVQVRTSDERRAAFDVTLCALRKFRRDHMPSRRPTPATRVRIPVERHTGEPTWPALAFFALCLALVIALAWVFDAFPGRETSGLQRRARVGARTTVGNLTAKCGGPVGDDPAEFVRRAGCLCLRTRTCAAGRSRAL